MKVPEALIVTERDQRGFRFCLSPFKPGTPHKAFFRLPDVTCSFQLRSGRVQGC